MKIYIASPKHLDLPCNELYQPLYVGAYRIPHKDRRQNWLYDDTYKGNISKLNSTYCELTGLHWIWKQSSEDTVGLVHYRRYFESPASKRHTITQREIEHILDSHDCIIPERIPCLTSKGRLVSVAEQYRTFHPGTDLIQIAEIIKKYQPNYYRAFLSFVRDEASFAPYNMIICKRELLNGYLTWLFEIETRLSRRISPLDERTPYQQRVFGFISERLLNVYLYKNKCAAYQCPVYDPSNSAAELYQPLETCPKRCEQYRGDCPDPVRNGIDYSPVFDTSFYLSHYSDLHDTFRDCPSFALDHYLTHGVKEGRVAHPRFSINSYVNGNPQIWNAVGHDHIKMLHHFMEHGNNAQRAIGHEDGFYKQESTREQGLKLSPRRLMRDFYIRDAEQRGYID